MSRIDVRRVRPNGWRAVALMLGIGLASLSAVCGQATVLAADPLGEANIVGEWWTEERDGRIRFFKAKTGTYTGRLTWSKKPRNDIENDDPKLRSRPIVGIILMWKLKYEDGEYVDGHVYNPEDGNTYRIDVKSLSRDSLEIRGYVGLSIFGQSQVWTRYR
jgi:uncharacterized protein (DUF2147 family)